MGGLSDRVYDHSAEHGLISLLLQHPSKVAEAALALKEEAFALPIPRAMFKLIKHLVSEGQTLDTLRIISEAQRYPHIYRCLGEEEAVANIEALRAMDTNEESFDAFVESIKKHFIARQLIDGSDKLKQRVLDSYSKETSNSLLSIAQEFGSKLAVDNQTDNAMFEHMGSGLSELLNREIPDDGIIGIRTLYPTLDRLTLGLQPKEAYTFVAQSGVGKSTLLKCIATRVAIIQRIPTLYLDTEMDKESQQFRMLAELADVQEHDIKTKRYRKDLAAIERIAQAKQAIDAGCLYHRRISDFSRDQIKSLCRYAVMSLGVKVIVYDYIKIPDSFAGEEREHVWLGKLTSTLKNEIASDLNVTVLTAAQSDQHDPFHVADSARIERYSTFLGILTENQNDRGNMRLFVKKNRFGPKHCNIYFNFNAPYLKIEEGKNSELERVAALPLDEGDAPDGSRQYQAASKHSGANGKVRRKDQKQPQLSLSDS